jgi:hypothetical protein
LNPASFAFLFRSEIGVFDTSTGATVCPISGKSAYTGGVNDNNAQRSNHHTALSAAAAAASASGSNSSAAIEFEDDFADEPDDGDERRFLADCYLAGYNSTTAELEKLIGVSSSASTKSRKAAYGH